jgi:arginine exporter protein ArgO
MYRVVPVIMLLSCYLSDLTLFVIGLIIAFRDSNIVININLANCQIDDNLSDAVRYIGDIDVLEKLIVGVGIIGAISTSMVYFISLFIICCKQKLGIPTQRVLTRINILIIIIGLLSIGCVCGHSIKIVLAIDVLLGCFKYNIDSL